MSLSKRDTIHNVNSVTLTVTINSFNFSFSPLSFVRPSDDPHLWEACVSRVAKNRMNYSQLQHCGRTGLLGRHKGQPLEHLQGRSASGRSQLSTFKPCKINTLLRTCNKNNT